MKKIMSMLLIFALVMQMASRGILVAGFKLNQKYIAENLCVNRDRPEMHCMGLCQLKKELEDDDKREKKTFMYESMKNMEQSKDCFLYLFKIPEFVIIKNTCFLFKIGDTTDYAQKSFRPPTLIS